MHIIDQLASASGQKEQALNIELAQKIAATGNKAAVKELIEGLEHKTKAIRHDCIKVLYEIAYIKPGLLAVYGSVFVDLLDHKDNRMQWGAMTVLSSIAAEIPAVLFNALGKIVDVANSGSVITRDHCVRILVVLAGADKYASVALPLLQEQILGAPVNQVPSYAEQALPVIDAAHKAPFIKTLTIRLGDIEQDSKRKRVEKVLKKLG